MLPFRYPFTSIVSGPTGSGKTQFVMCLVDNADAMIEPTPRKILYYFVEFQPLFESYEDRIKFHREMPKADTIERLTDALVVYYDLMNEADKWLRYSCADRTTETSRLYSWCKTLSTRTDT